MATQYKERLIMELIEYQELTELSESQVSDIEQIYRAVGWWQDPLDNTWIKDLPQKSSAYVVAVISGKIVGMGRALSDAVSDAYIQDIAVLPAFRHRGIARGIVQKIIARLHARGVDWIGLIAAPGTQELYQHLGFNVMKDFTPMLYKESQQ